MGAMMLPVGENTLSSLFQNVLSRMRNDDVSRLVKTDSLIIQFGERLYGRRDVEEHTSGQINSRLRELGRLMLHVREKSQLRVASLTAALDPSNFDFVIASVRDVADFSDFTHTFQKGNLALKIGYSLKKCCKILQSEAIKKNDDDAKEKAMRFATLIDGDWYDSISAAAAQSATRARMNQPTLIPSLADVEKVICVIEDDLASEEYSILAKATLASITIFNRKRGGELQRMKVADFVVQQNTSSVDAEVLAGLTNTEQKLVKMLARMEIRGKLNRPVPILLTPKMVSSVERLLQLRSKESIESPYLFASPAGEKPYRGSDVLRCYAVVAKVGPALFTATSLRKQLATLSQAMELSKMDQDQVATFLGHDIRIHRSIYRRPIEVIQKAKVASVLFKLNKGLDIPAEMSEETLEHEMVETDPNDPELPEEQEDLEDEDMTEMDVDFQPRNTQSVKSAKLCGRKRTAKKRRLAPEELEDEDITEKDVSCEKGKAQSVKTAKPCATDMKVKKRSQVPEELEDEDTTEEDVNHELGTGKALSVKTARPRAKTRRRSKPKKNWSKDELSAVETHLSECFRLNRIPRKEEAVRVLAEVPLLRRNRTWKDLKYCVYNRIQKYRL